jgi:hypothetical protein
MTADYASSPAPWPVLLRLAPDEDLSAWLAFAKPTGRGDVPKQPIEVCFKGVAAPAEQVRCGGRELEHPCGDILASAFQRLPGKLAHRYRGAAQCSGLHPSATPTPAPPAATTRPANPWTAHPLNLGQLLADGVARHAQTYAV